MAAEKLSQKHSIPYHIHLSETRKEVFDCLQAHKKRPAYYLDSLGVLSSRTLAAHCVWLTKEEVRLLASKGVSSSLCVESNMKLSSGGTAPLPEMQECGMNISLGTDGAASNNSLSMFSAMKFTGLLVKNARWDATAAKEAGILSAAAAGGAQALGLDAGELKEGKLADIILLDKKAPNLVPAHSNIANIVYSAHAGNVTDTIINGEIVMRDRKLLTVDEEKIIGAAQEQAESLI
ncbi:5'-deoxyadenosine deaminase [uncultured archaeon]|nr:5'-deoxyadenosine deaminase [uncultured archaeon]